MQGGRKEKPGQRDTQRARSRQVRIVNDFQGSLVGADDALQLLRPKRLHGHAKNLWTGLVQATNVDFYGITWLGCPRFDFEDGRRASRYSSTVSLTGCSMSLGSLPVVSSIRAKRPAVALP